MKTANDEAATAPAATRRLPLLLLSAAIASVATLYFASQQASNEADDSLASAHAASVAENGDQGSAADREPVAETVLQSLLAQDWPESDLKVGGEAAPVLSREDFVRASTQSNQIGVRQQILSKAYPARYNESGQAIVLPNHRFFSVNRGSQQGEHDDGTLFLYYPNMHDAIEAPVTRLLQYEFVPGEDDQASFTVPVEPVDQGLLLRLKDTQGVRGGWTVHVSTVHALANGPQRYFILLQEKDFAEL